MMIQLERHREEVLFGKLEVMYSHLLATSKDKRVLLLVLGTLFLQVDV